MKPVRPPIQTDTGQPQAPPTVTPLTESRAEAYVASICFKIGPPRRVGVELEWLVQDARDPDAPVDPARIDAAVEALGLRPPDPTLPAGSRITREPGGQVELSSPPADSLTDCAETTLRDLGALRTAFAARGLSLVGLGTDPYPRQRRVVVHGPRYAAMEEFFGRGGPWGKIMMCASASVQVCLDAGTDGPGSRGFRDRWRLLHLLGPVLVAAFANSPLLDGRPTGRRSTRQAVWERVDPSRSLAPTPLADDPRQAWARYVLDAELLCVRRGDGLPWTAPGGLTFRDWLRGAGERPATLDDLDYHLTTLFPPVRPQGHLELRMIDAQPDDGWLIPTALVTALLDDDRAADAALAALEPLADPDRDLPGPRGTLWTRASTHAVADPDLRRAAVACFAAADEALPRLGAPAALRHAVAAFADRYPGRGRCPADDQLDALAGRTSAGTRTRPGTDPATTQETAPC
ncbi:ergothioneine biosynthesis glutamate--cysteine ligase EgtA [Peterkaempfera bronchialis]|uniref:ergothioneine biosynthesis glutamate--cysteine ligase EgtA n=1 Tax=Peterkaempfera bronchialis TaxID=2126346 RepID=UPI001E51695F|nr:ergothioneine biosynthesis glutamate--cysteine ligase EgtA [Peterkaempfera bronchialis]